MVAKWIVSVGGFDLWTELVTVLGQRVVANTYTHRQIESPWVRFPYPRRPRRGYFCGLISCGS
jgi:hypothetical protein